MKPEFKEQGNLMASIHTVLKRLVPKEAHSSTNKAGDIVYRWKMNRPSRLATAFGQSKKLSDGPPTREEVAALWENFSEKAKKK
jgi:predicted transcriptional regulator